jgi:hypothetical protein
MAKKQIDRFTKNGINYIWIEHGAEEYGLPVTSIKWWFHHRCKWTGKKLTPPIPRDDADDVMPLLANPRVYVIENELDEIASAKAAGQLYKPADDGEIVLLQEAKRISGMSKEQLMRAHKHGTRKLRGRKIWAEKKREIGADGRKQPQWHFRKGEMEKLAESKYYNDPIIRGWLSPEQAEDQYGVPYHCLRTGWANGSIRTKDVPVPEKWCQHKELTYSNRRDVAQYAKKLEQPSELDRACDLLKTLLTPGPEKYKQIKKQANLRDISEKSLRRAKKKLGVLDSQPGLQSPSYWYFPQDKDKLPKTSVPPEKRPLRTEALKLIAELMAKGVKSFKEASEEGKRKGLGRGTMWLAWCEAQNLPPESANGIAGKNGLLDANVVKLDPAVRNELVEAYKAALQKGDDGYVPAKLVAAMTAWSLSQLSKLCRKGGPVRFRRPGGNRLEIHAADMARHINQREERAAAKAEHV